MSFHINWREINCYQLKMETGFQVLSTLYEKYLCNIWNPKDVSPDLVQTGTESGIFYHLMYLYEEEKTSMWRELKSVTFIRHTNLHGLPFIQRHGIHGRGAGAGAGCGAPIGRGPLLVLLSVRLHGCRGDRGAVHHSDSDKTHKHTPLNSTQLHRSARWWTPAVAAPDKHTPPASWDSTLCHTHTAAGRVWLRCHRLL